MNFLPSIWIEDNHINVQYLNVSHKFILDWKVFFLIGLGIIAITYVTVMNIHSKAQQEAISQNQELIDTFKELLIKEDTQKRVDTIVKVIHKTIQSEESSPNKKESRQGATYCQPSATKVTKAIKEAYVAQFHKAAISEMKLYNIPASITLAQALHESNAGLSCLARDNNNHFGIKCFSKHCKKGHCTNYKDDTHKDFFRNYASVWQSYREHSKFLQRPHYKHLTKSKDYKEWAYGLKKAGYATDKKYANKLIKIIETMKLYEYDKVTTEASTPIAKAPVQRVKKQVKKQVKGGKSTKSIQKKAINTIKLRASNNFEYEQIKEKYSKK